MRRRAVLAQFLVLGLVAVALASASAGAARESSARVGAAPQTAYSEAAVVSAFRSAKIKLHGRPAGNHTQPVTAYTAVVPTSVTHQKKPWAVQVWVYEDPDTAAQAYRIGIPAWRENGLATKQLGNLIVTVVPKGVEIGTTAAAFPMPKLVTQALAKLQQSH
jgi:hypothetical protein